MLAPRLERTVMAASKKKFISLKDKIQIISKNEEGTKQSHISEQLSIAISTVSKIWKNRDALKRQFQSSSQIIATTPNASDLPITRMWMQPFFSSSRKQEIMAYL